MNNVTAYIGLNYGDSNHTFKHAMATTAHALAFYGIDGATFCQTYGLWQGESEDSMRVDLLNVDAAAARRALKCACRALKQWEIVYTVDGKSMFSVTDNAAKRRAA